MNCMIVDVLAKKIAQIHRHESKLALKESSMHYPKTGTILLPIKLFCKYFFQKHVQV